MLPNSNHEAISIVVPTHNRSNSLRRLLRSLDGLAKITPAEVIVVDDGSREHATGEVLQDWLHSKHMYVPKVVTNGRSHGPGFARNAGVKASSGSIIAFTDDDCVVEPNWLAGLVPRLVPDGHIVGVGGRVLPLVNSTISRYYSFHKILEPPPSLLYLVSANCCYQRGALETVGGFDEDIQKAGGEDIGLSFKLARAGGRFAYAPDAVVYHDYRNNVLDFMRTFRNYGRGSRTVTEKYYGRSRNAG